MGAGPIKLCVVKERWTVSTYLSKKKPARVSSMLFIHIYVPPLACVDRAVPAAGQAERAAGFMF